MSDRFDLAYANFTAALVRFEEALALPRTHSIILDGSIQRFEFTLETAWKVMKRYADLKSVVTVSPRDAVEAAFVLGLIDDDGAWTAMLKDRNLASHTYREALAEALYARLPGHLVHFNALRVKFEELRASGAI